MKIYPLLVFPPGWVPYAPYLALPILKGFLEKHSIAADIKDVNLEFYDHILSRDFTTKAFKICEEKFRTLERKTNHTEEEKQSYYRYSRTVILRDILDRIDASKDIIRSERFYDEGALEIAKNILLDALYIIETAYGGFKIDFNEISLKSPINSSEDVMRLLDDKASNLFIEYYESSILEHINRNNYNFVGISVTVMDQLTPALTLACQIKKKCPNVKHIVFGGNYITRLAVDWIDAHPFFRVLDYVICYEGEDALSSLIETLQRGTDLSGVPNLCYVRGGKLQKNTVASVDINDIAAPNFDGFPLDRYFMPELILPLFTSRCCYSKCAFCTIAGATYGKYRTLNVEDVFRTMEVLSKKYSVTCFTFVDETFAPPRMAKLAEIIADRGGTYRWYCETRFEKGLTEDFFKQLYRGGCRKIQFGLESYNQRILDLMRKNIQVSDIQPSLLNCLKGGIAFHLFFMIGFPTEIASEAQATLDFTKKMLELSYFKYNNRNSTRGYGTFSLEKHSYIYDHPEEFFLKIIDAGEKDTYARSCAYVAEKGLSQQEAGHIHSVNNKKLFYIYGDKRNFHLLGKVFASEEEHFLKHVHNIATVVGGESRSVGTRRKLRDYPVGSKLSFSRSTRLFVFNHNPLSDDSRSAPMITFYNCDTRACYPVDSSCRNHIDSIQNGTLTVGRSLTLSEPFRNVLMDLIYYNFLEVQGTPLLTSSDYRNAFLTFNRAVIREADLDGHVYLFNIVTGKFMKMNKFSLLLLKLLDGKSTLPDILVAIRREGIKIDTEKFAILIDDAVRKQMVYAYSEDPFSLDNETKV